MPFTSDKKPSLAGFFQDPRGWMKQFTREPEQQAQDPEQPVVPSAPPQQQFQSAMQYNPQSKYGKLINMGGSQSDQNQMDKFQQLYQQNKNAFGFNY